ncbi:hypothetical protein VP275E431_P0074 [Vibrio phage 275E43-1]|nr:hypothetical protein VP275E431_P0074 [Vibrio phage 275E43-1]
MCSLPISLSLSVVCINGQRRVVYIYYLIRVYSQCGLRCLVS